MSLLRLVGTEEVLEGLHDVVGLRLVPETSRVWTDDVRYQISGTAPAGVIPELERRGCEVYVLMTEADIKAYNDEIKGSISPPQASARAAALTSGPLVAPRRSWEIEAGLATLAATFPQYCQRVVIDRKTHGGNRTSYLKIGVGPSGPKRPVVLFTGGLHGREWTPPDALLSLAENLLTSYHQRTRISFPSRTIKIYFDPAKPLPTIAPWRYPSWTVPVRTVVRILEKVDLLIYPLVNPDGRDFDLNNLGSPDFDFQGWRQNHPDRSVDLNRNFPLGWDYEKYYDLAAYRARFHSDPASKVKGNDNYRGERPLSENETQNVSDLMRQFPLSYHVDVHTCGRAILWAWAVEQNGTDPLQNYRELDLDGKRDGMMANDKRYPPGRTDYKEFLPAHVARRNKFVADRMGDAILRSAHRGELPPELGLTAFHTRHVVQQNAKPWLGGGPKAGTSSDYATSLMFEQPGRPATFACTFEAGGDEEGMFHPVYAARNPQFQKQNREIHAGLIALLDIAATSPVVMP